MTTKRREGEARTQSHVESLPLAILTLSIEQKRLTPAVYKQIIEEDIIDEETGDLRGTPVGYFNIHAKEGCPQFPHKHVLWGNGTRLRLANVVPRQADLRYRQQEHLSHQLTGKLIEFLALVLAGAKHVYSLEETGRDSIKFVSTKYTLSVSGVTVDVLLLRDRARQQWEADNSILLTQSKQEQEGSDRELDACREQLQEAEVALQQISELGMEVAHPVLYRYEHQHKSDWSTLKMLAGWHAYPSERSDERNESVLYWKSKDHAQRMKREHLAPSIEPYLASHGLAMRVILGERMMQQKDQSIRELADRLGKDVYVLLASVKETKKEPAVIRNKEPVSVVNIDPSNVWAQYEQEKRRLQELTQQWDRHLETINALDQLFLLS